MKKIAYCLFGAHPQSGRPGSRPKSTIPDESCSLKGKMLNIELTDAGGVVTVEGIAGR